MSSVLFYSDGRLTHYQSAQDPRTFRFYSVVSGSCVLRAKRDERAPLTFGSRGLSIRSFVKNRIRHCPFDNTKRCRRPRSFPQNAFASRVVGRPIHTCGSFVTCEKWNCYRLPSSSWTYTAHGIQLIYEACLYTRVLVLLHRNYKRISS